MKFYDKYPKLKDRNYLFNLLSSNVFSTMSLENQEVSILKIQKIVDSILEEKKLKNTQFFLN